MPKKLSHQYKEKEISFKENTTSIEGLPFPIVLYPGFYGSFFAFKEKDNSEPHFCSCAFEAIENYLKLRSIEPRILNSNPARMFIFDSMTFPSSVVKSLMDHNKKSTKPINLLNFKDKLCHECNKSIPYYRYCHEMYGGSFKQNLGWYINKQAYEWGVQPISNLSLPESCPEEINLILSNEELIKLKDKRLQLIMSDNLIQASIVANKINKFRRKLWNIIENEVRRKFGQKKIGEAWTSETILYYIVRKLFPEYTIYRHYRPKFLKGLELDIYIEEIKVGIEYQGIQHYKPIKHWGGQEALTKLQERDSLKKELCKNNHISLIYFEYYEGLSDPIILEKINSIK